MLAKATAAFGEVRLIDLRSEEICAWRGMLPEGLGFEATQALRQVLNVAFAWKLIDVNRRNEGAESAAAFPREARGVGRIDEVRIHELTLATSEIAGQSAFWGETLGLPVRDAADGAIEVSLQESTVRFEQSAPGVDPRYHFAINVPRGSIHEAAAWIAERHELLAFHRDPDEEEGATIAHTDRGASALYFLDGAGNVAELIANDHLDNGSDAPFGPDSFLEIAEIGVATADTEATRAAIQQALSAEILWGGREGWQLTAIGDDHGVVIVAPKGRGWIPVGLPAQPLPTTIVAAAPLSREVTLPEGPYRIRAVAEH